MNEIRKADIYKVRAVSVDRWDVEQDSLEQPLASFADKGAALNFAMCLARGRPAWHLRLRNSRVPHGAAGPTPSH